MYNLKQNTKIKLQKPYNHPLHEFKINNYIICNLNKVNQ